MNTYETRIIGGIVAGTVRASDIDLAPSDFSSEDAGAAIIAAQGLEASGIKIDASILHARLDPNSDSFYTASDFELMAKQASSAAVVWDAVDKVKGEALKTMLLSETANLALRKEQSGTALLDSLKDLVLRADANYRTSENNFVFLSELVPKVKAVYNDLHAGVSYAVSTGFELIDAEILDGFSRGDEHILVGFTGSGKSALALNMARRQAINGVTVGIVSREMSDIENIMRLQSSDAEIPRWTMRKGMFDSTLENLHKNIDKLSELPICFDTRTTDVNELRPQVRRMVESYNLQILYVDYLQLMSAKSSNTTRANEVQAISRTLKEIAMENKIPVVSLCQFNRGAMQASIFEILAHLKESSGIEQDASTILYVQLEKTEERKQVKDAKVTVLKNRNGATFHSVELQYQGDIFTFSEPPRSYPVPDIYRVNA